MRHAVLLSALLLSSGCVGPHVTGSLWVLQNAQMDQAVFRMSDDQRAEQVHQLNLSLADETLAAERARLEQALQACPTRDRRPFALSDGDRVRDTVRIRAGDDDVRRMQVAQLALADWRIRRANATGDSAHCEAARAALAGRPETAQRSATIDSLGEATVARGPGKAFQGDARTALSLYAAQAVDGVTAHGPLPRYLAAIYGGSVISASNVRASDVEVAVDKAASAYPDLEPDALFVALSSESA